MNNNRINFVDNIYSIEFKKELVMLLTKNKYSYFQCFC